MIQTVGEAQQTMSYASYLAAREQSEVKLEFNAGEVYAMSGGTVAHARLAAACIRLLGVAAEPHGCAVFSSDLAIGVAVTGRTTYADAVVLCDPEEVLPHDPHAVTNPSIIVEVLSASTEASDRGEKFRHYQHLATLQSYVLISQEVPLVEVFERQPTGWMLRTYGPGEVARLAPHDIELPVDMLYADARYADGTS